MTVELHLGDCRDWIPKVAADLVVTDPPYDVKTRGGGIMNERPYIVNGELHSMNKGMPEGVLEACIAMTSNVYVWGNWASIRRYLPTAEGYSTNLLSWHKSNPIPTCSNKYLGDMEYCLFVRGRGVKVYGGFADHRTWWVTPLNTADKRRYGHPTVKPLDIIRTMVRNSCPPGGTVFDPFMGTGTTGVAAIMEGRSFVGCEIDPRWYAVAEARIAEAQASVRDGNNNE